MTACRPSSLARTAWRAWACWRRGSDDEINNPLTFVTLNLEEIRRLAGAKDVTAGAGASDVERVTIGELATEALDGARRVQDIVQDLRRFARGEERTTTAVDVHAALDGAIRLAANQIRYRARLVRDFAPDLPLVVGNTSSLTQVFLNLIVNAAQAMPEGSSETDEIRVRTSATDDDVRIELSDTGAGMAPENMARISIRSSRRRTSPKGPGWAWRCATNWWTPSAAASSSAARWGGAAGSW